MSGFPTLRVEVEIRMRFTVNKPTRPANISYLEDRAALVSWEEWKWVFAEISRRGGMGKSRLRHIAFKKDGIDHQNASGDAGRRDRRQYHPRCARDVAIRPTP